MGEIENKGVQMAVESVVEMLVNYYVRQNRSSEDAEVAGDPVIDDLARTIQAQLEEHTGYTTLWQEFERDPVGMAPELMGVLEMVVEGLPQLAMSMEAYVAEWDRQHKDTSVGLESEETLVDIDNDEVPGSSMHVPDQVDDFYDGTYLYGTANTRRGTESEGRTIGLQEDDHENLEDELESLGMHVDHEPGTFTRISVAVDQHPDLDDDEKEMIKGHLDEIETQVALEEDADLDSIRHHLRQIHSISTDISEALRNEENFLNFLDRKNEPGYMEDLD
jgi:hypothetical protein